MLVPIYHRYCILAKF